MARRKMPRAIETGGTAPLPELTSDQMRLLGPLVTPRALELARQRLIDPRHRMTDVDADETTRRVALILLLEMNPAIVLTNEEDGIRRGVSRETVGRLKMTGAI